ncbi:histone-lysine N-methyltransferase [Acrasis kona]|uniref:Histone-lysine N-methyltransferase n=1 Tax=Acrasis kona TaxID=1008807 RepID=A0AAW2ZGT1_9EUKA
MKKVSLIIITFILSYTLAEVIGFQDRCGFCKQACAMTALFEERCVALCGSVCFAHLNKFNEIRSDSASYDDVCNLCQYSCDMMSDVDVKLKCFEVCGRHCKDSTLQ